MDTPTTPTFMRTFTLWANNRRYELNGETFAKMSKKCGQLMQQGKTQGILQQRVRDETLEAFLAASQLQQFKVTRNNAFELLDIATEWEVNTLVTFVSNYIKTKNLERPDNRDPVGDLVEHAKNKDVSNNHIIAVCNIINDALTDERLFDVPPEIIFEILIRSDQRSIDQVKLLDFVISLFNEKSSAAVPLVPLIDFGRLTKEQDEGIFLCPQLHEENISFFLAWALSSTRSKADRERYQADLRHFDEMSTMREVIQKVQSQTVSKMKSEHDEKIRQLLEIAKRQEAEIADLENTLEKESTDFDNLRSEHDRQLEEIEERIQNMKEYAESLAQNEEDMQRVLAQEVKEPLDAYHNQINEKINELNEKNNQGLNSIEKSILDPVNEAADDITELDRKIAELESALETAELKTNETKTAVAVKVVRDTLRHGKFIRNSKEKMNLFDMNDGEGIWGIKSEDAIQSSQQINELIKRIDAMCPLNECD